MKFNHLNVPTHWQNYWTRYPEGHTILEALISWVSQVDSMVDNQNNLNDNVVQFRDEIDAFVDRFDDRLQTEVTQTLSDWQDSGFINVVISAALQWELDQTKKSIGISIVDFERLEEETHDLPRFQRAIDFLEANGGGRLVVPNLGVDYIFNADNPTINNPTRVLITSDNIEIVGVGMPIIKMTGIDLNYLNSIDDKGSSGRDVFTAFSFLRASDCKISGLKIIGEWNGYGKLTYTSPRAKGVGFIGTTNCEASYIEGENILGNTINGTGSDTQIDGEYKQLNGIEIRNCKSERALEGGYNLMGGTANATVTNNVSRYSGGAGFEGASIGLLISNNVFEFNRTAGTSLSGVDVTYSGNVCRENGSDSENVIGAGLLITYSASAMTTNVIVTANNIVGNKGYGLQIYPGASNLMIANNNFVDNVSKGGTTYQQGMYIVGSTSLPIQNVDISNNLIKDTLGNMITGVNLNQVSDVNVRNNTIQMHDSQNTSIISVTSKKVKIYDNVVNKPINIAATSLLSEQFRNILDYQYQKVLHGSAEPTTGTWIAGDIRFNTNSTEEGTGGSRYTILGWVCYVRGTFGSLSGVTGSVDAGSSILTVTSTTNLAVDQYITIAGVSGVKRIVSISGTTITLSSASDATVTNASVTFSAPLFREMRVLTGN